MTEIGLGIRQRAKALRDIIAMYKRVTMCNTKPETDINQSQFLQSRVPTQPVLAQEKFGVSQNSSRNFTATFQCVSRWIQIRHVTFHSEQDRKDSNTLKFDAWLYNNGSERNVYLLDA